MSHADSEPLDDVRGSSGYGKRFEERMQAYSRSFRDPDAEPEADPQTVDAARETLRWFNSRLVELAPGPIDDQLLVVDLTVKRDWALHALINHGGPAWAKREQLAISDGHPLAICTGGRFRRYVATVLGVAATTTRGCYGVFEEATNTAGKKWPPLCPRCQPRAGHRNPHRDAERALQARAKYIASLRSPS